MGFLRRPSYYKDFQCISSACTDSCCQQWEIDIDEETLEFYMSVGGSFGARLRENIALPESDEDAPAHFIQAEKERCPFLNENNLCDIFTECGEEHLSWICTHHPRYYDWFQKGQEAGLGLCCEEAARLMLNAAEGPDFEVIEDGEESEEDEDNAFDLSLEEALFGIREELFAIIRSGLSHEEVMNALYAKKEAVQDAYDNLMFGEAEEIDDLFEEADVYEEADVSEEADAYEASDFSIQFWNEIAIGALLNEYQELEVNDPEWWNQLLHVKEQLPELLEARRTFEEFMSARMREYDNLLVYFLFRYFMKGREDGMLAEKLQFALLSVAMIELLGIMEWKKSGTLTERQQIDIVKLYSKEIEYDEENMLAVSEVILT